MLKHYTKNLLYSVRKITQIWGAKDNAKKYSYKNTEFKLADIEDLPIKNNSIDVIISNCVINLAPDKLKVFKEGYRVLKPSGKMYVSVGGAESGGLPDSTPSEPKADSFIVVLEKLVL